MVQCHTHIARNGDRPHIRPAFTRLLPHRIEDASILMLLTAEPSRRQSLYLFLLLANQAKDADKHEVRRQDRDVPRQTSITPYRSNPTRRATNEATTTTTTSPTDPHRCCSPEEVEEQLSCCCCRGRGTRNVAACTYTYSSANRSPGRSFSHIGAYSQSLDEVQGKCSVRSCGDRCEEKGLR